MFMLPDTDSIPDSLASIFSNAVPPAPGQPGYSGSGWGGSEGPGPGGFGPGDYAGGYTGSEAGGLHGVYWGPYDEAAGDVEAAIAAAQKKAAREAARRAVREAKNAGGSGAGTTLHPSFGPGKTVTSAAGAATGAIKGALPGTDKPSGLATIAEQWGDAAADLAMLEELGAIETSAGTSASGLSTGDTVLLPDGRSVVISDPPSTVVTSEGAQTLAPGIDPDGSARSAMSEISGRSQMSTATSTTTTEPPVPRGKRYLLNPGAPEEDQLWIYHKWDREKHRYSDE